MTGVLLGKQVAFQFLFRVLTLNVLLSLVLLVLIIKLYNLLNVL